MSVRPLLRDDLEWITAELCALPDQSEMYADVPKDYEHVINYLGNMWAASVLHGAIDEENRSFLLYTISVPWYANRYEAHEMILWVTRSMRGGRTAVRLIKAYVDQVLFIDLTTQPIHSIHAGATLDITDAEKTLKLYELCGFKRDGHAGVKLTL